MSNTISEREFDALRRENEKDHKRMEDDINVEKDITSGIQSDVSDIKVSVGKIETTLEDDVNALSKAIKFVMYGVIGTTMLTIVGIGVAFVIKILTG